MLFHCFTGCYVWAVVSSTAVLVVLSMTYPLLVPLSQAKLGPLLHSCYLCSKFLQADFFLSFSLVISCILQIFLLMLLLLSVYPSPHYWNSSSFPVAGSVSLFKLERTFYMPFKKFCHLLEKKLAFWHCQEGSNP